MAPFPEKLLALPASEVTYLADRMFGFYLGGLRCHNPTSAGLLMAWLANAGVQVCCDWYMNRLDIRRIEEADALHKVHHVVLDVVEGAPGWCVDITVDTKDHLYITNGITTHNTINFGIIYGVSAQGLAEQIPRPKQHAHLTHKQWISVCEKSIENYFDKYRGVRRFINQSGRNIRKDCQVVNYFGRVRHLPTAQADLLLGPSKKWMIGRAKRQGTNSLIQGTAADVFKIAAVRVHDILKEKAPRSRLVNFVHDEVQIYLHKEETAVLNDLRYAMEDFNFDVPLVADFSWSKTSWADKKKLG
jgi:hypothetical protein